MANIDQLTATSRVKVKFHLPALSIVICLQRKMRFGWKTVSWIYPSVFEFKTYEYVIDWLVWRETYKRKTESEIANNIMEKKK